MLYLVVISMKALNLLLQVKEVFMGLDRWKDDVSVALRAEMTQKFQKPLDEYEAFFYHRHYEWSTVQRLNFQKEEAEELMQHKN